MADSADNMAVRHSRWLAKVLREQIVDPVKRWAAPLTGVTAEQENAQKAAALRAGLPQDVYAQRMWQQRMAPEAFRMVSAIKSPETRFVRPDGVEIIYGPPSEAGAPGADVYAVKEGRTIGRATFSRQPVELPEGQGLDWESGPLKGWQVNVDPKYRRQGIATDMYRLAESASGKPIAHGSFQTPEGEAFAKALREKAGGE